MGGAMREISTMMISRVTTSLPELRYSGCTGI
jgi:hypothetical protein